MIDERFGRFNGACPDNTINGYRADCRRFTRWCDEQGETLKKVALRGGWQGESTVIQYLRAWQAA